MEMLQILKKKIQIKFCNINCMKTVFFTVVFFLFFVFNLNKIEAAVSYISSTSGNGSQSVVLSPTNIQDGDIMIAFVSAGKTSGAPPYPTAISGPAGWTVLSERVISSTQRFAVLWKRALSESGSYTFTQSYASATMVGAIGVYRGAVTTGSPIDVLSDTAYVVNDTIVRASSVIPTTSDGIFVYGGYQWGSTTLTAPTGMNSRESISGIGNGRINMSDLLYSSTSASGDKDGTAGASTSSKHAFMASLVAEPPAPPTGFSCSITTQAGCTGTVLLRMSGSTNAHAELPSQSTSNYNNNVVCCTGVAGLSNSCLANNKEIFARLSGVTNAHVERNTESNVNYNQNVCLASTYAGDEITIGYQANNCDGYDTTLFSMSNTPTNSQVGIPSAYNNKVCAKIFSQSITFDISAVSVGFGNLSSSGLRYATSDGSGSSSETESYHITVSTNAPSGYGLYIRGDTLKNGAVVIDPIGGSNITPTPGSNLFGLRAVASGGSGSVVAPYSGSGFAYDATDTSHSTVAQASSGDGNTTTYSIRTVATIDSLLDPGNYSTNLTYIVTANF